MAQNKRDTTKQSSKKHSTKPRSSRAPKNTEQQFESDSTYFLKLVVVAIIATLWIKLSTPIEWFGVPIGAFPLGVLLGFLFVRAFERHQSDRKLWYVVLVLVGIVTYFLPAGIVV